MSMEKESEDPIECFSNILGYDFYDKSLLTTALRHRSWVSETAEENVESNERLEFLGDAVLTWVVTDILFTKYPELSEGDLTGIRKRMVANTTLYDIAKSLNLETYIYLGRGELVTNINEKKQSMSILADAMEAIIGAIYVDSLVSLHHTIRASRSSHHH